MDFILDSFRWSFSRVESFFRCPKCFYLQYIKCLDSAPGVYAEYGSLCHSCLEEYAKGNIFEFELSDKYKNEFDISITCEFPPNQYKDLKDVYYDAGLQYFDNFNGFGDLKILGVENEYRFKIGKYDFTGKIDLECENCIVDHKTKGSLHVEKITKKNQHKDFIRMLDGRYIEFRNFIQLYVYCIPYIEKYGKPPETLVLNMVRINDWYEIKFDNTYFEKAKQWMLDRIEEIYNTKEFVKGKDVSGYWCNNTCSMRFNCSHSNRYTI